MTTGRRPLLAAGVLPLLFVQPRPAHGAEFSYRLATGSGITELIDARLQQAAGRIREATNGRLDIQCFPASRLGPEAEQIAQLRAGGTEFLNITGSRISSIAPASDLVNMGFVFSGYDLVWPAMDGGFGQAVRAEIEKAGVLVVSKAADNGFRQVTSSSRPVGAPDDLKGFRIRVPDVPAFTSLFTSFGAVPVLVGFDELVKGLRTGVIDGQENSLAAVEAARLSEVQRYASLTNHIWDPFWLLGNPQAMARLPADVQAVVRREFDRAASEQRDDMAAQNAALQGQLSAKGLAIAEVDKAPFRAALVRAGFYAAWKRKVAPDLWSALEAVTGSLT